MTSSVQNLEPGALPQRAAQTAREQTAMYAPIVAANAAIVWPYTAPPNRGDPHIPLPAANPPSGGSILAPAPPNMSFYNYFDYAYATPGGWVASPGLPPWLWPQLFRTVPNRSPDEAALGSQMPHPVQAEVPPRLQGTTRAAPPQSEQAAAAQAIAAQRPVRPQRPAAPPAPPARAGTSNPSATPGQPNIPLGGGARTVSGVAPSPQPGQRASGGDD